MVCTVTKCSEKNIEANGSFKPGYKKKHVLKKEEHELHGTVPNLQIHETLNKTSPRALHYKYM